MKIFIALLLLTGAAHAGALEDAGLDPEAVAEKEAFLYDRFIRWHTPYGQPWGVQWLDKNGNHTRDACNCSPGAADYCGDQVNESTLQVNNPNFTGDPVFKYGGDGDSAIQIGHMLAMQAYKVAVTHDPLVELQMRHTLDNIVLMYALRQSPGLFVRSFAPPGADVILDPGEGYVFEENDPDSPYFGYSFRHGDMTRDQYSGLFYGLYTAWRVIEDEEIQGQVEYLVREVLDALIANNYTLHDTAQNVTFDPFPLGFDRANMILAYLQFGYHVTGDQRYKDEYDRKVTAATPADITTLLMAKQFVCNPSHDEEQYCFFTKVPGDEEENYYQFNITAPSMFMNATLHLSHAGDFRDILTEFYDGCSEIQFSGMRGEKNSLFAMFYAVGMNGGSYNYRMPETYSELDADAVHTALQEIALYPEGPRYRGEFLSTNIPLFDEDECGDNISSSSRHMSSRPPAFYAWENSPHHINSSCVQPWVEYPALDFLETYWMARYYGFFLKPSSAFTSTTYSTGKLPKLSFTVTLTDWIPDESWAIGDLVVALYDNGGHLLESKTLVLPQAIDAAHPIATVNWTFTVATRTKLIRGNGYFVNVSKSLRVPAVKFPNKTTVNVQRLITFTVP